VASTLAKGIAGNSSSREADVAAVTREQVSKHSGGVKEDFVSFNLKYRVPNPRDISDRAVIELLDR
jgi:hypothetical protein